MTVTTEKLAQTIMARLPKWAREEVEGLQKDVQRLQAQLDQFQGTVNSRVSRWTSYSETAPLPDRDDIRFALPNGQVITIGYRGRQQGDRLEIYGLKPLVLTLKGSNIIEISQEVTE